MVHALDITFSDVEFESKKVTIENVISDTGLSYGLSTWFDSTLHFDDDTKMNIKNVQAGYRYLDNSPRQNDEIFV